MGSKLRNRLKALSANATAPPPSRPSGVVLYSEQIPLNRDILSLPPVGLRRIGWTGGRFDPRRCLFLDTETTGLSGGAGTVAFLVGVGFIENRIPDRDDTAVLTIEQFLMRDYADEPELIDTLARRMERFDALCTFNGLRFDMPLLEQRFIMTRMRHRWRELPNLDLLYPARRTWKLRLGRCNLGRLEEEVLGKSRENDLPGSQVPQRYFDYLKSGDLRLLDDIVRHNRQDIATLAELLCLLCALHDRPEQQADRRDIYSVARTLERQGEYKNARALYHIAAIPPKAGTLEGLTLKSLAGEANRRNYILARRSGDLEGMRALLTQMQRRRQLPYFTAIEWSKLYEHIDKDYDRALRYAQSAGEFCPENQLDALEKRIQRIRKKTEAYNHGYFHETAPLGRNRCEGLQGTRTGHTAALEEKL